MATVYILYSEKSNHFYFGSCKDLEFRIKDHTCKKYQNSYTAKFDDWKLFLAINNLEYEQARKIEKHIKKMKSNNYILNLNKYENIKIDLINKFKS